MIGLDIFSNIKKNFFWSYVWKNLRNYSDTSALIKDFPKSTFYSDQSNSELLRLVNEQYLSESGFLESIEFRRPQRNGLPIPWFTFSAIDYLDNLDLAGKRVLEVGGGFSTLYWARRGLTGLTLECDPTWCNLLVSTQNLSGYESSMELIHIDSSGEQSGLDIRSFIPDQWLADLATKVGNEYSEETEQYFSSKKNFLHNLTKHLNYSDVVVIDGISRNICMMLAAQLSPSHALIILDNSDRVEYAVGQEILKTQGWRAMRFSGLGPLNPYKWETAIFFR
jgi:hypothetical protein